VPADDRARALLDRAKERHGPLPPDDGAGLLAWLATPGPDDPPGVGRYLTQIWRERVDLQETFPGLFLDADQRDRFLLWAHHFAGAEPRPSSCPRRPPASRTLRRRPWRVLRQRWYPA
jgi:hypothetical protein